VRIILHRYIHADIYRKLNTKYDANGALDFNKTYETYGSQYGTMAVLYINSMKEALKAFHKNVLTEDYNKYIIISKQHPAMLFMRQWLGRTKRK
jgi:hypothetical protein